METTLAVENPCKGFSWHDKDPSLLDKQENQDLQGASRTFNA